MGRVLMGKFFFDLIKVSVKNLTDEFILISS